MCCAWFVYTILYYTTSLLIPHCMNNLIINCTSFDYVKSWVVTHIANIYVFYAVNS